MTQSHQEQRPPGDQHEMDPRPDCDEAGYVSCARVVVTLGRPIL